MTFGMYLKLFKPDQTALILDAVPTERANEIGTNAEKLIIDPIIFGAKPSNFVHLGAGKWMSNSLIHDNIETINQINHQRCLVVVRYVIVTNLSGSKWRVESKQRLAIGGRYSKNEAESEINITLFYTTPKDLMRDKIDGVPWFVPRYYWDSWLGGEQLDLEDITSYQIMCNVKQIQKKKGKETTNA